MTASTPAPLHITAHANTTDRLAHIAHVRHTVLDLAQAAPLGTAPWLARSWQRCLARGRHPTESVGFEHVSAAEHNRTLEHHHPLLQAARPVIASLVHAVAGTRYFTLLTDASGVVIDVNGEIDRRDRRATNIARVGVNLSEQAVGTTAIGATLAEMQPVWLHRGEHFFNDTGVYSCAGAPLLGPQGECVGMLDLTGIQVPERPALKHLVAQSARRIENALVSALAEQPHHLLLRLGWPGQTLGHDGDGLLAVDPHGTILGHNPQAANMLGLLPRHQPMLDQVLAMEAGRVFDLARAAHTTLEVPLWSGLRLQVQALTAQAVPQPCRAAHPGTSAPLRDVEDALIRQTVQAHKGNVAAAAKALGISRATVYRKLAKKT